jgi:hypothetical protein
MNSPTTPRGWSGARLYAAALAVLALLSTACGSAATSSPEGSLKGELPTTVELGRNWTLESPPTYKPNVHGVAGVHCKQSIGGDEIVASFDSIATGAYLEVRLISSPRADRIFTLLKQSIASGCYFTSESVPHSPTGSKSTKIEYRPSQNVEGLREIALQGRSGSHPMIYTLLYFVEKGSTLAIVFYNGIHSDLNIVRTAISKLR